MENLGYVLSFIALGLSVVVFLYEVFQSIKLGRVRKKGLKDLYVKNQDFGLAMNSGSDPCKIKEPFELSEFSQDCDYLV